MSMSKMNLVRVALQYLFQGPAANELVSAAPPYYPRERTTTVSISQTKRWEEELLADPKVWLTVSEVDATAAHDFFFLL